MCGSRFDAFAPAWNRPSAICWRCGSHERHRALWLYLTEVEPSLLRDATALLHFAPEHCLGSQLRKLAHLRYVTADLDPEKGELQLDLLDLALENASFDAILCSHVLEHIPDDRQAMRELHRVLDPHGWCIVMVPLDLERDSTYEDFTITEPEERKAAFWQEDHVRIYAPDIRRRLEEAGFEVDVWKPRAEWRAPYGLLSADLVFLCRKG